MVRSYGAGTAHREISGPALKCICLVSQDIPVSPFLMMDPGGQVHFWCPQPENQNKNKTATITTQGVENLPVIGFIQQLKECPPSASSAGTSLETGLLIVKVCLI